MYAAKIRISPIFLIFHKRPPQFRQTVQSLLKLSQKSFHFHHDYIVNLFYFSNARFLLFLLPKNTCGQAYETTNIITCETNHIFRTCCSLLQQHWGHPTIHLKYHPSPLHFGPLPFPPKANFKKEKIKKIRS